MTINTNNTEFANRLAERRASIAESRGTTRLRSDYAVNDALTRESVAMLTTVINALGEELNLDLDKLDNSIKSARKSPYGRITELVTKVASIYAWPISNIDQANEIPSLQDTVLDVLASHGMAVDGDLLLDIKEAKGYNSFLDRATYQIVDGVEPEYEALEYYILTFADLANLPIVDFKMSEAVYDKLEQKALDRITTEQEAAKEALARHDAMMKQQVAA